MDIREMSNNLGDNDRASKVDGLNALWSEFRFL